MTKSDIFCILCLVVIFLAGGIVAIQTGKSLYTATDITINDAGYEEGEYKGNNDGFVNCYETLGMHWLGSRERFLGFQNEYGNIHNTPWDKFTIEEKCVIAMYGGSGSKLKGEELREFAGKYGVDNAKTK